MCLPATIVSFRHSGMTTNKRSYFTDVSQLCTVDMEIRALERETISLVPELVFMESDTVLVQYIISSWSLQLRNASER